jgi:hypothetical protein
MSTSPSASSFISDASSHVNLAMTTPNQLGTTARRSFTGAARDSIGVSTMSPYVESELVRLSFQSFNSISYSLSIPTPRMPLPT